MALHSIDEDGTLYTLHWHCHHKHCAPLTAPISHEQVTWFDHNLVALPPCPCGARCFVKVSFTDEELAAPNMLEYGMVSQSTVLPRADTGEPTEVMVPSLAPIGPNPFVARHQRLAELMDTHGKTRVTPPEPSMAASALSLEETVNKLLQEHGLITTPRISSISPEPISNE